MDEIRRILANFWERNERLYTVFHLVSLMRRRRLANQVQFYFGLTFRPEDLQGWLKTQIITQWKDDQ